MVVTKCYWEFLSLFRFQRKIWYHSTRAACLQYLTLDTRSLTLLFGSSIFFFQGTKTATEDETGFLGRLKKAFCSDEDEDDTDNRRQGNA